MVSMVYPSQCPIPIGTSTEQSIPRNEGLGDGAVGKERPCRQTVEALLAPPSTAWQPMATMGKSASRMSIPELKVEHHKGRGCLILR